MSFADHDFDADDRISSPPWSEDNATLRQHIPSMRSRDQAQGQEDVEGSPLRHRPRPFQQRRAVSASHLPAVSSADLATTQATFESPLRSILVSGPPTASVSANTALASLSSATPSYSSAPAFAALTNAGARRAWAKPDTGPSSSTASVPIIPTNPVPTLEKGVDDPDVAISALTNENDYLRTSVTLSRLFTASDATTPGALSRFSSHLRSHSNPAGGLRETSTLNGHLFHNGFMEGRHSDIIIIAFGQRYKLHKLLLDRVPFFSSAFSGPWAESSAKEMVLHPKEIDQNITQTAFELAIKRIYGTQFPELEEQEAVSLFATACWLDMPELVESCVEAILNQMETTNLHELIRLVTNNYYGKPGDRILSSAKALLCREGWEMPYSAWDKIPSEIIREIVGGDPFFIPTEWERWFLATKILNRKLRTKVVEAGLISEDGRFIYPKPSSLRFFAVRFDTVYRRESGWASARHVTEKDEPWVSLYTSPEISPLLILLDEGVHYMHLRFEQLQQIRSHRDILGVPVLPEKVISDALWMSMELRQRVVNADENDLDLGLAEVADEADLAFPNAMEEPRQESKGKQPVAEAVPTPEDSIISDSWDGTGAPRKFWIPNTDVSCVMGGTREANLAANAVNSAEWSNTARLSASLEPTDLTWASDFVLDSGRPLSQSVESDAAPTYSKIPPFRFAAEFPHPRALKEKKRVYSSTVWYAGSMWNLYIQRVHNSKTHQLGIYLHRAKDASDEPVGQVIPARSVDDRIGQLERELLLRKSERRPRPWGDEDIDGASYHGRATTLQTDERPVIGANFVEKDEGPDRDPRSPGFSRSLVKSPISSTARWLESELEDEELLLANRRYNSPALPNYLDARPVIKTYFKIYSIDKAGRMLSIYESAPEKFVVSKSWGWKSSPAFWV